MYLPAAKAGWVSDTLGWLEAVRTQSFGDFINRKGFQVHSFYQLTQTLTWLLYQVFGSRPWPWHLLHVSLHALNISLLFALVKGISLDAGIKHGKTLAWSVAALFCCSPYVSEVIVWEASFHFLQGLMLQLVSLLLLRQFLLYKSWTLGLLAVALMITASFSLEIFILTPLLGGLLCLYYSMALAWEKEKVRAALKWIIAPQMLVVIAHFIAVKILLGSETGRLGNSLTDLPLTYFLVKPQENLFHLFGGRFLSQHIRDLVYKACSNYFFAGLFYAGALAGLAFFLVRFQQRSTLGKAIGFAYCWLLLSLAFISPLWFPQRLMITGDRYLYVVLPPFFLLLALLTVRLVRSFALRQSIAGFFIMLQLPFLFGLNKTWQSSEQMISVLQQQLSDAPGKVTILLNSPASLRGAPMIGAGPDGEAQLMHRLLFDQAPLSDVVDAPAQHLIQPYDSITIEALSPNAVRVSLTQPGAYWQWESDIAHTMSTPQYDLEIDSAQCCYTLTLKQNLDSYRLLYQQNGRWMVYDKPE